jgi:hypothetical protein
MTVRQVCLDCRTLTANGSRCEACAARRERLRNGRRQHYKGAYRKQAKWVRDNAVTCWICGEGERFGDPWTADHLLPGNPDSPLAPAHRSCNSARGDRPVGDVNRALDRIDNDGTPRTGLPGVG